MELTPLCSISTAPTEYVQMAHGAGGKLSHKLMNDIFLPLFRNKILERLEDAATQLSPMQNWAFASDAHVVRPLFFNGGDLGKLAVLGTANDLAMVGAQAKYLTMNWILEEGLELSTLKRIAASAAKTARELGIEIVAGDTKVVERGKGDQVFISTSGIGIKYVHPGPSADLIRPGDCILVSGDLGRHGIAVLSARAELGLETEVVSDCAPLFPLVRDLIDARVDLHALRDLTRGGLAAGLWELGHQAKLFFEINEADLPVGPEVRGASELLGLEPISIANEGTMVLFVPESHVSRALALLRRHSPHAAHIGRVDSSVEAEVVLRRPFGGTRWLELPAGEPLPRIC